MARSSKDIKARINNKKHEDNVSNSKKKNYVGKFDQSNLTTMLKGSKKELLYAVSDYWTKICKCLSRHPNEVDENYHQHARSALLFALQAFYGSILLMIHALVPCLLVNRGGDIILKLATAIKVKRGKRASPQSLEKTK